MSLNDRFILEAFVFAKEQDGFAKSCRVHPDTRSEIIASADFCRNHWPLQGEPATYQGIVLVIDKAVPVGDFVFSLE
ncbi:MAG TPA: hypothetical protein VN039_03340 [Nitrospira sp.]|nr:hypothetical protein [Nitrospira sp.]